LVQPPASRPPTQNKENLLGEAAPQIKKKCGLINLKYWFVRLRRLGLVDDEKAKWKGPEGFAELRKILTSFYKSPREAQKHLPIAGSW
jgi:hypothetical protein